MENGIEMYLSTIVVSEYAVGDDPDNLLSLNAFRLLEFDYADAKTAGSFFLELKGNETLRESEQRKVIINDIKLFSQIHNRQIDAYITKDRKSLGKMIEPLGKSHDLNFEFICKKCKHIYPIYENRCPHCHSILSFQIELEITRQYIQENQSLQ